MPTTYTLNATAVPAIQMPSATLINPTSGTATVSEEFAAATAAADVRPKLNRNLRRVDALGRAGAGAYAIQWSSGASSSLPGFNLTVSSGLTLAIAQGVAVIDGPVVYAGGTIALTDNIARIYLWINQAGVITAVNNSTTPPAGANVFLGSVVTSGGAITQIDGSGVLYFRGPDLWRQTADTSTPGDTPPTGIAFINYGASGVRYKWDGAGYFDINASLASGAVIIAPATTARNIVQPTADVVPLTIRGRTAGQTEDLQRWRSAADALLLSVAAGGHLTFADAVNIVAGTGTGTKIGTATTQKLGFYNAAPIVQPANTTDLRAVLINLGLLASGGATPLDLNGGALTTGAATHNGLLTIADSQNIAFGTTNGGQIGTAANQKLGFFGATPIVQPGNTTDLRLVLINLGLLASGGATPLNLNDGLLTTGNITITDGRNVALGTGTGTCIGTGTSQKLGFFNTVPVVQQTGGVATAGATYGGTEQTMINAMYTALRAYGLLS